MNNKATFLCLLVALLASSTLIAANLRRYERFRVRANGKVHEFSLANHPGWTLRASLPRYQTAALSLTIVDQNGVERANIIETPGHITGGFGRHKQYRLPKTYLDPFHICIEQFSPGREVLLGLYTDRLAYCKPLRHLQPRLEGYRCIGKTMNLKNAFIDPVLGIVGAPAQELTNENGSHSIVRYFIRPKKRVKRAGYLLLNHHKRSYRRLLSCAVSRKQRPEGRLFNGGLLALSKGPNSIPKIFAVTSQKVRTIKFPQQKLKKELNELSPNSITLTSFNKTKGILGPLYALSFYIESATGAHLLQVRIRKNEIIYSKVRELTPKERALLAPAHP